ncbi:MAG TPA: S9 family peptidase [Usitatibacter sp.]|nr:S9 family peptidase [Usitatibacter sp.]
MKRLPALFALAAASCIAAAAEVAPSIETFFRPPQYRSMLLSPDGEHIAALVPGNGRQNIAVINTKTRKAVPVTGLTERDVVAVQWISSKRLLYWSGSLGTRDEYARGGGLYAIDRDGSDFRMVGDGGNERMARGMHLVVRILRVVATLPEESDDFIAQEIEFDGGEPKPGALVRVDSRSGRRTPISFGKPESAVNESWIADSRGVGRVLAASSQGRTRIYYRKAQDAPWEKLDDFSVFSGDQWVPLAVAEDDRTLYVASWKGRDKAAIMLYDPEARTFGEVLAAHPQVDLSELVRSAGKVIGVSFEADNGGTAWFDEELARTQAGIDRALPGTVNRLSGSRDRSRFIVTARSDVKPASFYLFDRSAGRLEWLADAAPWIDPKAMSPVKPVRYKARDGLEIPGYLTVPKSSSGKSLPMVVMIHGGPWVPGDTWYYHPEVQFLASRGYAVLQPNFRGTTRYGWKHFSSSFRQWGLAMQDDITDGVKWAVEQGVADPARICIYGASYGGYATMMGLAKTPELFKCGINYVGVTDLNLFATAWWADYAESEFPKYGMKAMVGDLEGDKERLKTTSPVEMAARIKAPVLMAYGSADRRVVPEHGTRMKSALEERGAKPLWMMVDGEGHGFREMQNQVLFYGAMEKFLAEHIGGGPLR